MRQSLYQALIKDLGLEEYDGEQEHQIICRALYAATAQWMRYFVLDEDETGEAYPKSKQYLLKRAKETVQRLVNAFPEAETWFRSDDEPEEYSEFFKSIREDMIRCEELYYVDGKIMLPELQTCSYPYGVQRVRGIPDDDIEKLKAVGLTRIMALNLSDDLAVRQQLSVESKKFTEWIFNSAKWEPHLDVKNFEFFNPYSHRALYQSWDNRAATSLKWILGRLAIVNGFYEYYLMKRNGEEWYSAKLEDVFLENKDYRRIMLGLRSMADNQIQANAEHRENAVILHLYCKLPVMESAYIRTFCWPLESYSDELNYVVPIEVWPMIKDLVRNLCIHLEEKSL